MGDAAALGVSAVAGWLDVRPDERARVAGLFATAFAIGAALAWLEIATQTALLVTAGPAELPWASVAVGGAVLASGVAASALRASPAAVLVGVAGLAALAAPWASRSVPGLVATMAVHGVLSAWAMVGFWSRAAARLDVAQSRRLYGLVGAGELVGIAVVGALAGPIRAVAGGAVGLIVPLVVLGAIGASAGAAPPVARARAGAHGARLFVCYGLYNVTYYLIEFALWVTLQAAWGASPARIAGTLGALAAARVGIGAAMRALVTGRLLARIGLTAGLASAPLVVLASIAIGLAAGAPLVAVALAASTGESIVRNALAKPAFLLSQRALPDGARDGVLAAVETVVEPLTTGLAGVLLLTIPAAWRLGPAALWLPVPTAIAWAIAALSLGRRHPLEAA